MKNIFIGIYFILFSNLVGANTLTNFDKQQAQKTIYASIFKLNQLTNAKYHPQVMQKFITSEILPLFDFDYMSYQILKNKKANANLVKRIKGDIAGTILSSLAKARGRVIVPIGVRIIKNNIVLTVKIRHIKIDLLLRKTQNGWKIFDIWMQNQGLINYYKQGIR